SASMVAVLDSSATFAGSPEARGCCQRTALLFGSNPTAWGIAVPGCFLPKATARSPSSTTFAASKPATLGATSDPLQPATGAPRLSQPRQSSLAAQRSGHQPGRPDGDSVPASTSSATFFSSLTSIHT